MNKEIKIDVPAGYCIDEENSTFECIKFKPIEKKRFVDDKDHVIRGFYITSNSEIALIIRNNTPSSYNIFSTKKQAKSALAMARISQIMANDERFGGAITDEEWNSGSIIKYVIGRTNDDFYMNSYYQMYHFLAFHTPEQRDLFLKENGYLVEDYLMID